MRPHEAVHEWIGHRAAPAGEAGSHHVSGQRVGCALEQAVGLSPGAGQPTRRRLLQRSRVGCRQAAADGPGSEGERQRSFPLGGVGGAPPIEADDAVAPPDPLDGLVEFDHDLARLQSPESVGGLGEPAMFRGRSRRHAVQDDGASRCGRCGRAAPRQRHGVGHREAVQATHQIRVVHRPVERRPGPGRRCGGEVRAGDGAWTDDAPEHLAVQQRQGRVDADQRCPRAGVGHHLEGHPARQHDVDDGVVGRFAMKPRGNRPLDTRQVGTAGDRIARGHVDGDDVGGRHVAGRAIGVRDGRAVSHLTVDDQQDVATFCECRGCLNDTEQGQHEPNLTGEAHDTGGRWHGSPYDSRRAMTGRQLVRGRSSSPAVIDSASASSVRVC